MATEQLAVRCFRLIGRQVRLGLAGLFLITSMPLLAAEPAGFAYWSAGELKGYTKKLAPKMNAQKLAAETLGTFGNHSLVVAHRAGDGEAEIHATQSDVFIVQSGEATLIIGGELVGGKTTAPNEIRGPSIKGGTKRKLMAGDMVHIPTKVPHQLLVAAGKHFTYAVVKVDSPAAP